ncbi:Hypothetical predicted protein [Mytilus galloprovincialis]|uniref:Reverse transcriptase domain-containing protein n=1 Tax=Mytilus galloprovincialis TaxID=29158 RepID=A0A8B6HAM4_MYTGA|nr:Hypothetical predicted protein [Mytilus galloprovincialis]
MYINELATDIENSGGNGIFIHENFHNVMLLLFAGDLAHLADTPVELQRRLNNLEKNCEKWNMTINMDKSNIVVFKNGGGDGLARSAGIRTKNGLTSRRITKLYPLEVSLHSDEDNTDCAMKMCRKAKMVAMEKIKKNDFKCVASVN